MSRDSHFDFNPKCRDCPRLARHLARTRREYPDYHAGPVPAFGPARAPLTIVGLAPGLHGANRTGRPFTGDHAGILLYRTLHEFGFSSRPASLRADDGLRLRGCRITNAVKCLPPQNRPTGAEVRTCNRYLRDELKTVPKGGVILALGGTAHRAVLSATGQRGAQFPFRHGAQHLLPDGRHLVSSYHCSRYNTQTRRLTAAMFQRVFERVRRLLDSAP
jgi:uracil-DNA glycosylase family 4